MSKWNVSLLILVLGFVPVPTMASQSLLSYSVDGNLVVKNGKQTLLQTRGKLSAISPKGDKVAFFRDNNVYIADLRSKKAVQLTNDRQSDLTKGMSELPERISWSPSGSTLAYTRVLPYRVSSGGRALELVTKPPRGDSEVRWITSIWLLDISSKRTFQAVEPMGDIPALKRTCQLVGASVYEPVFSPDGRQLWFLNPGCFYEIDLQHVQAGRKNKARLVAKLGGLDTFSKGMSKGGWGVRETSWDSMHGRLCYWIDRFWGTGVSEYGYVTWKAGKWGKPTEWHPAFAPSIESAGPNINECVIDAEGKLWVDHTTGPSDDWMWERIDGGRRLPVGADRPSFVNTK